MTTDKRIETTFNVETDLDSTRDVIATLEQFHAERRMRDSNLIEEVAERLVIARDHIRNGYIAGFFLGITKAIASQIHDKGARDRAQLLVSLMYASHRARGWPASEPDHDHLNQLLSGQA